MGALLSSLLSKWGKALREKNPWSREHMDNLEINVMKEMVASKRMTQRRT